MFFLVDCLMLDDPGNGTVNCSLGDDGIPSYEDTCNYTCDSGFELFGSDQRMCLFDGTWSSGDVVCDIGMMNVIFISPKVPKL